MLKKKFSLPFEIDDYNNILLLGVGGGYDIITAMPIYFYLKKHNKNVILGSTNYVHLQSIYNGLGEEVEDGVLKMYNNNPQNSAVMEAQLAAIISDPVYSFQKLGVRGLTRALKKVRIIHAIDLIIAVDGGIDSLITGKEKIQGTPVEDLVTITALNNLPEIDKVLCCVGMGAENDEGLTAELIGPNILNLFQYGFLGTSAWTTSPEVLQMTVVYNEVSDQRKSHIIPKIIDTLIGKINEDISMQFLLPICWFFNLKEVVNKNILSPIIQDTYSFTDVVYKHLELKIKKRFTST